MRRLARTYYVGAYYLSWFVFALVALGLNLGCLFRRPFRRGPQTGRRTRAVIRVLFDLWVRWFHASGVLRVYWHGFDLPLPEGTVYVANHPSLIDATVLMARLPDATCIFKPRLMENPAIGTAAIMADYSAGTNGVDLIREVADKVAGGCSLMIFPEGTRTSIGARLEPLKPGFALIAARAQAPVQAIIIRVSRGLVPRGRPWWHAPEVLPGRLDITLGRRWERVSELNSFGFAAEVERYLREQIQEPVA